MADILGIISYTAPYVYIRGLSKFRPVAAYNYVGRYRLCDIPISNMTNSGMDNIQLYTNGDPKVLFDHIGSARHYNLNNKHGHVAVIPTWTDGIKAEFVSDMHTYWKNLDEIVDDKNDWVVIAPCNWVYKANFNDLVNHHIESKADISILYQKVNTPDWADYLNTNLLTLTDKKAVAKVDRYRGGDADMNVSLDTYIMSKDVFVKLVKKAHEYSPMFWMTDTINAVLEDNEMNVRGVPFNFPIFPIMDLKSYFRSNMEMLNERNMSFFNDPNWPIYTRTNDSPPTIYIGEGTSSGALISNGCEIAGTVTGSILGRGVKVGKGALIDNCLILPGAEIGENAMLTNVIVDKDAKVIHKLELSGYDKAPLYINRRETI